MASGQEIINSTGQNFGVATDAGAVGASGEYNTDYVNQIFRDAMLLNHQKQLTLFQQKVKDRDTTYDMINSGQLNVGDVLDQDRPLAQQKVDKVWQVFKKYKGDVTSKPERWLEMKAAINDAQDTTKHAQSRMVEIGKLRAEAAKQTRPDLQKNYKDHIDKMINQPFWNQVTPYQQMMDWDPKEVDFGVKTASTTLNKGLNKITETSVDVPTTMLEYQKKFADPNFNQMFYEYANDVISTPNAKQTIDLANERLVKYNKDFGYKPGDKNYVNPINVDWDSKSLKESPADFAAKLALAKQPKFKDVKTEFDAQRGQYSLGVERNAIDRAELKIKQQNADTAKDEVQLRRDLKGANQVQVNEAAVFANSVINKVKDAANPDGTVDLNKAQLTAQELQMLGLSEIKDGKFQIRNSPEATAKLKFNPATNRIEIVGKTDKDGATSNSTFVDFKQIAFNKYGIGATVSSGKESNELNFLAQGYAQQNQKPLTGDEVFVMPDGSEKKLSEIKAMKKANGDPTYTDQELSDFIGSGTIKKKQ
jgi:hypothetical protein